MKLNTKYRFLLTAGIIITAAASILSAKSALAATSEGSFSLTFATSTTTTIQSAPTVSTTQAVSTTQTSAVLQALANPNGASSTGWFRLSTINSSSFGSCSDSFGTRAPASSSLNLGAGNSFVSYSASVTGLTPSTTYSYCAVAENSAGKKFGFMKFFSTLPVVRQSAPTVSTTEAVSTSQTSTVLQGLANPNGASSTGWFRYSAINSSSFGSCSDSFGTRAPASSSANLGAGNSFVPYSFMATGLTPSTTYFYCAVAENRAGKKFGLMKWFSTLPVAVVRQSAPTVSTTRAIVTSATSISLGGVANPNGASSTGWFRYSTSVSSTCNDTFGTRTPAFGGISLGGSNSFVPYASQISGLAPSTTYFYCAIASNNGGKGFGLMQRFQTLRSRFHGVLNTLSTLKAF